MSTSVVKHPPVESKTQSKGRVLVIDDEIGLRDLLRLELTARGYTVDTASDGEQGIQKVKTNRYRLALCDINMPKVGGLEALKAIKAIDPAIEVVMMTAFATIETAVEAMHRGAYHFVQKPFQIDEIFAVVERACEKRDLKSMVAVYAASQAVFNAVRLEELFPLIAGLALDVMNADDASIILISEQGQLSLAATAGLDTAGKRQGRLALVRQLIPKLRSEHNAFILSNQDSLFREISPVAGLENIQSLMIHPLSVGGEQLGYLSVSRTESKGTFEMSDTLVLAVLSSQIAQALVNARLYQRLESQIDQLKEARQKLEITQNQLIQSEKLAGIGQLAAGVAHELNNPLSGILGFTQVLLQEGGLTDRQRGDLGIILEQSQRCRAIIQNLLDFSRRREPHMERLALPALLDATMRLVHYDFDVAGIVLEQAMPQDLPDVMIDPNQFQQVLLNLLANARQAVAGQTEKIVRITGAVEGDRLYLRIEDNGPGVSENNRRRIFDPFFTTKAPGEGTGLGLSLCYGILKQQGCDIYCETSSLGGASFVVVLPVS